MPNVTTIICPKCHKPNLREARFCQKCGADMILNNETPSDEKRYVITKIIKEGGMGAVYEGVDQEGKVYAIKEMLDHFTDPKERDEAIKRFNAEAKLLKSLHHERIPQIYSHFIDEGRYYLTMDLVVGEDLQDIVEHEGPLGEEKVLEWAYQICDVLAYLHSKDIVYRDMKPSNVMIEAAGGVKLVDFGIAKTLDASGKQGTQIGTPGYAPPEQYQGNVKLHISDVYALGATLHFMLTGRDPTQHAPFSFPAARDVVSTITPRTSMALERALQMRPEDRFGSVVELRMALRPLAATPMSLPKLTQQPKSLSSSTAPQSPSQPAPKSPAKAGSCFLSCLKWGMLTLVLLIGLAGLAYFMPNLKDLRPSLQPPKVLNPPSPKALPTGKLQMERMEVEAVVAVDATTEMIRKELLEAFAAKVQAKYPGAKVSRNMPPSFVSAPEEVQGKGKLRYKATVEGFIQLP